MVTYALTSKYCEVAKGRESGQVVAAMGEEMESLNKNQNWELVMLFEGHRAIKYK